jgi:hypothetical protein
MLNTVIVKKHLGMVTVIMPRVENQNFEWHSTCTVTDKSAGMDWMLIRGADELRRPIELKLPRSSTNYMVIG